MFDIVIFLQLQVNNLSFFSIISKDNATIDCTLSSESTGKDCLENLCQRISIKQPEFFGLRYQLRSNDKNADKDPEDVELRWVDLERPLLKQLEKHADSSKLLYLRVMYYVVSRTNLITDDVTRTHYFLQLKKDVVEGKLLCDTETVRLAA